MCVCISSLVVFLVVVRPPTTDMPSCFRLFLHTYICTGHTVMSGGFEDQDIYDDTADLNANRYVNMLLSFSHSFTFIFRIVMHIGELRT